MGMSGADLIRAERHRQVQSEGYTAEHDAGHEFDLVAGGRSYAQEVELRMLLPNGEQRIGYELMPPIDWPWDASFWKPTGDNVRDLVKAGALIAAAIDAILAERAKDRPVVDRGGIRR